MGLIRSFFGIAEPAARPVRDNSSNSSGSGTVTRTSGMSSTGWHAPYDEETARRHHREAQAPVPPAATDRTGRRLATPDPYQQGGQHVRQNFGGPYTEDGGAQ
ncbi:hypothetical protein ACFVFS_24050 [Kitasatospora sp. NPDC057692]|uniref:hypothetical protein n=1 Tax=Kitasatospora sp. NPDC057692 TaxID=3346215 RepID=UPI0036840B67